MAGDLSVHQKHAFYAYDSAHEREGGLSFEVLGGAWGNFIYLLAVCELVFDKKKSTNQRSHELSTEIFAPL